MRNRTRYYKYRTIDGNIFLVKSWHKGGKDIVEFPIARKDEEVSLEEIEAIKESDAWEYQKKHVRSIFEI